MSTKATIALCIWALLCPLSMADEGYLSRSVTAAAIARTQGEETLEEQPREWEDEADDKPLVKEVQKSSRKAASKPAPKAVRTSSHKTVHQVANKAGTKKQIDESIVDPATDPVAEPLQDSMTETAPPSVTETVDESLLGTLGETETVLTPMADLDGVACGGSGCCKQKCCLTPCTDFFRQRCFVFGDFLYLKAFGPDLVHATQQNAAPAGQGTVPYGNAQNLMQPWQPAFRVGGGYAFNNCSSISVSYMQFFSNVSDTLDLPTTTNFGSVVSSVLAPGTVNSGTTFSRISAVSSVNFRVADLMYNRLIFGTPTAYLNWSAGVRYGHLHQNFEQDAQFAQPNNPQFTTSSINFDGVGPRVGLDGRRRLGCGGFSAYGQGSITTLFGETVTGYSQTDTLTTALLASSNMQSFRVLPLLDCELGLSWTSCGGHLRVGGGYYTAFWFNAITTPQYISAVQNNHFISMGDTVTFTGAVVHAEARF